MLSREDFEKYGQTTVKLANQASAEFDRFIKSLNVSDYWAVRETIFDFAEGLIREYGGAAALNAADFFEAQTGIANALVSESIDLKSLDTSLRYAISQARYDELEKSPLSAVNQNITRQTKNQAHKTMVDNARRNHAMFARVPTGAHTCAFCMMLASRGFVYYSKQSAGEMMQFHNDCDCHIVAGVDGVEGYDPDVLCSDYRDSRENADSGNYKDILAQMRKDYGVK
ncbi:VG15 protein [Eubacterium sp.]|uniref:VG15 protein n=1 Tax=Eubacterium sp. TaxID=142586 RepID=UPI002FC6B679